MTDMSTQAIEFARQNLDKYIALHEKGEADAGTILIAAKALLRVLDPAAIEDTEYYDYDLTLPRSERCLATGEHGRVCGRRYGHVSPDHRDMEVSWTEDLRKPKPGSRVRASVPSGGVVEGTVTEVTHEGGRVEYMVDLDGIELGFRLHELEVIK